MTNRLAAHVTHWKWWYALLATPALLLGSAVMVLAAPAEDGSPSPLAAFMTPLSFLLFAALSLLFIALVARRWPSTGDLGLRKTLGVREIVLLIVVFVVTHLAFWLLSRGTTSGSNTAEVYFRDLGLASGLLPAFLALFASVVLAPVCEEILYRGAILRPIHDHLARKGRATLGAILGITVSTVLFAMPHLGDDVALPVVISYLITGVAFGLVYVITGSMTAAMVSHSLQSCWAFAQVLMYGSGDTPVSPLLYVLVFGGPIWVFLIARGLHTVLPKREAGRA